jgi:hypothetical protein
MESKTPYTAMLSSTFRELMAHRQAIRDAMLSQRFLPVAMEDDAALPDHDLISASLAKIDEADAYVGLIGHRYGQIPACAERNPEQLSLTELEFRRALARAIPICMFLMHDDHPIPKKWARQERGFDQQFESFVRLVKQDRIYAEFDSVPDLKAKAIQSLVRLREVLDARRAVSTANPETLLGATAKAPAQLSGNGLSERDGKEPGHQVRETLSDKAAPRPQREQTNINRVFFSLIFLGLGGICGWLVPLLASEHETSWIVLALFSLASLFFAAVGIKPKVRFASDQRIVARSHVRCQVGNNQLSAVSDNVGANRLGQRRFTQVDALLRLKPLPVVGDETDKRDRHSTKLLGKLYDIIKGRLWRCVENAIPFEGGEAVAIFDGRA